MKLTRRRFLIGSAAAAAATAVGNSITLASGTHTKATGNYLIIPETISGGHLGISPSTAQIFPGNKTGVFSVNNAYPAPTIRVRKGDMFSVHIVNNLTLQDLVLHWHGLHAPPETDGHPRDAIHPSESK